MSQVYFPTFEELAAIAAMQGMLAAGSTIPAADLAHEAAKLADALAERMAPYDS